jgi:hypothetical protein
MTADTGLWLHEACTAASPKTDLWLGRDQCLDRCAGLTLMAHSAVPNYLETASPVCLSKEGSSFATFPQWPRLTLTFVISIGTRNSSVTQKNTVKCNYFYLHLIAFQPK